MHAQTPVQQYPLSSLTDLSSEKSKHLHLSFPSTPDGERETSDDSESDDLSPLATRHSALSLTQD